jgi:hypothetical protein
MDDKGEANVETEVSVTMKEEIVLEGSGEREYPGWRIPLSVVTGIGWLVFLVIWLFFYAGDYKLIQNIGMFLLSIMFVALILGVAWAAWAFSGMTEFEQMMMQMGGMKNRMILSMIIPIVSLIFLGLWLFLWAVDYDVYQNIAIVIVVILVMGGLLGVLWTTGGWKMGGRS